MIYVGFEGSTTSKNDVLEFVINAKFGRCSGQIHLRTGHFRGIFTFERLDNKHK